MKLPSRWWWDLSAAHFAALDMSRVVAVLPVGAVEQHGPHLPVRVDAAINAGIVARAVELMPDDLPALVLPMMPVGKSNEHLEYAGTLTLKAETLGRLWYEIGASVHRAGCRRLVIINSHGGQPQVMEIVCRELRVNLGMLAVGCFWPRLGEPPGLFDPEERRHGIHAGEVETSLMLHLHPDLVDMTKAEDFVPLSKALVKENRFLSPEGGISFGWQMQDLHPAGAAGNAAAADAARGAAMVDHLARNFLQLLREVARFPLERLEQPTVWRS